MEIEAKFVLPDQRILDDLKDASDLAGFKLDQPRVTQNRDTYLDTEDRLLLSHGYVCRRRKTADEILITVKSTLPAQDAVHRREELEIVMRRSLPPIRWEESAARKLVLDIVGDQKLFPLVNLKQTRTVRTLLDGQRRVAELSLDRVRLKAGDQNLEFLEAEVELVEGSETELGAIVDCLQDEWGLQPSLPSKFERALKFLDEKKPRAPSASMTRLEIDDPIGEAARKTLLCHFRRMLQHEAGTRAGLDPEELHDMRVATRRMRAALEVFGRNLDPDTMKPFGAALRRVGRRLGSVRDLDVFGEKAEKYLDTLPENRRGDLDDLLAAWNVEREARRVEMVTHLDSHGYTQFKQKFAELLEAPGSIPSVTTSVDGEPLPYRVRLILPEVLHWSNARVQAYEEWLVNAPLSRYHQLRISSKGLRYTLEFFSDVLGPAAQPLIESVKRVQDHLGSLADAVVASGILRGFLRWGTWQASDHTLSAANTASSPGAAAYLAARQAEIQELVEGFPAVWAPIASKDFTRHLAELAGSL